MKPEAWKEARRLGEEGLSIRAVAKRMGVSRRAIRRAISSNGAEPVRPKSGRPSILDGYRGFIMAKLETYPELTAQRIFGMLSTMGYSGKYGAVKEYVRELRPKAVRAFHTLRFAPGQATQVDWAHAGLMNVEGQMRRVSVFVMTLCHSRMLYAELTLGESMEFWLSCHWNAFKFFGGIPDSVICDNCKVAVESRENGQAKLNRFYEDFASVCGFKIAPCTPYKANEKGQVEKNVDFIRKSFLAGRGAESFEGRRSALSEWLLKVANCRKHGTTGLIPMEVFADVEQPALNDLPLLPPHCGAKLEVQASCQFRVAFDCNRYSVPPRFAGRRLSLMKYPERVDFYDKETLIASHQRNYGRNLDILDPRHEQELRAKSKPGREQRIVSGFLNLGDGAEKYLVKLREKRPDWLLHAERILALEQIHGRPETARAVRDALENEAFHSEYIGYMLDLRAKPKAKPMPLQLLRGDDILKLSIPEPDLSAYEIKNAKTGR